LQSLDSQKKIKVSSEAQDLITKLLDKNPSTRLGAKDGIKEIKKQPFFSKIDFELISQKKINAPFKPDLNGKFDVQNFDKDFTNENVQQTYIERDKLLIVQQNEDKFKDF